MFGLLPRKRLPVKAAGGDGGALTPFGFPLFRTALFPEFDRLFDGFFRDWELPEMVRKVEMEEKPGEIIVRAEAPGFKAEEFAIELRDEVLILRALKEKKPEREGKEELKEKKVEKEGIVEAKEYLREEFCEAVMLPSPVMADKVTAKLLNGVLIVTLPKMKKEEEEEPTRRVPVIVG